MRLAIWILTSQRLILDDLFAELQDLVFALLLSFNLQVQNFLEKSSTIKQVERDRYSVIFKLNRSLESRFCLKFNYHLSVIRFRNWAN